MKNTPHNLVMSALYGGRRGERPPAGNPTSIICHGLMDVAGIEFPEAHLDAKAMAALAVTGYEVAGFDTVMPEFSVQQEGEALGCKVDWGHRDMMPDIKDSPHNDFHDVEIPHDLLEKPSMQVVLDALSMLKRQVGDQVAVVGKVMGPWTISYHLAGVENFLLQVGRGIRDTEAKDRVNRMLDQVLEVPIKFARAQLQAGADIVVVADHATGDLVSAKVYEEYLLPRHKIITAEIGGPLILHVCGNCKDRIETFAVAGFDAYHFEWQLDAKEAVERVGDRISLVGNIDNANVLFMGTPEDVYKQSRYAIESGVNIIGPECAIPLETPLENLKAITEAVREGY
jgi:[methyl-Co(III) methanol-specific corrinoid protein]:coenzyme M methyltransferase